MATAGLGYAMGITLMHAGVPAGALTLAWTAERPPAPHIEDAAANIVGHLGSWLEAGRAEPPTVLICHEEPLVAQGLARALERALGAMAMVATTPDDALRSVVSVTPRAIICSDSLTQSVDLAHVMRRLRAAGAAAPLLVLARRAGPCGLERALAAGATGYAPLSSPSQSLVDATARLLSGQSALPTFGPAAIDPPRLTRRELEVLVGIERGLSDKEIATQLDLSTSTVKSHARAIYGKLGACSRTAAAHTARGLGLI